MSEVDCRLGELGERYRASLPIKRASVELAWQALRAEAGDPVRLDSLQRVVHRIAGSAASYGYVEIGALACKADERLEALREVEVSRRNAALVGAAVCDLTPLFERLLDALAGPCEQISAASRMH